MVVVGVEKIKRKGNVLPGVCQTNKPDNLTAHRGVIVFLTFRTIVVTKVNYIPAPYHLATILAVMSSQH